VLTPLAAVGLCCVLLARKYTLKRNVVRQGAPGSRPGSEGKTASDPVKSSSSSEEIKESPEKQETNTETEKAETSEA
jgi:hypothetical protein